MNTVLSDFVLKERFADVLAYSDHGLLFYVATILRIVSQHPSLFSLNRQVLV